MPTLIAMAIHALFFWVVVRVILVIADRPVARTVTRSAHEQIPSGGPIMSNNRQEHRDFRKRAGGFVTGLLMGGLAGAWAVLLLVGGWVLRGRLALWRNKYRNREE